MKKIILLFLVTLIITGCDTKYTIEVTDDKILETINLNVSDNLASDKLNELQTKLKVDTLAVLGGLEDPYYLVTKDNENYQFNYTYDKEHPVSKSNVLSACFKNYFIEETENHYMFVFSDGFKCLYENKNIDITLQTKNIVKKHNSTDFDEATGTYNWRINKDNFETKDIRFIVLKSNATKASVKTSNFLKSAGFVVGLSLIIILGIVFLKKILKIFDKVET